MSFSIQTNINSMIAQENLRVNNEFQSRTIQRLTSGYRINSSGDDAAGLAVANKFRSDVAELVQGVRNANDGLSQLQIMDGGLNNISKTLDRLKTLATQSASVTFSGNRATVNEEFQQLLDEIDRQASNIGLSTGGKYNKEMSVYIGGGSTSDNAKVTFDLSGSSNRVDSTGLNLQGASVGASGVELGNANTGNVSAAITFTLSTIQSDGTATSSTFTYTAGSTVTVQQAVDELNASISAWAPGSYAGISFAVKEGTTSKVVVGGNTAFYVDFTGNDNGLVTTAADAASANKAMYWTNVDAADVDTAHSVTFTNAAGAERTVSFTGETVAQMVTTLNASLKSIGIYAVQADADTLSIQSDAAFTSAASHTSRGGFGANAIND
jgi:flagellin